jgi:drug/metabolite transporter (DMT)-like permease
MNAKVAALAVATVLGLTLGQVLFKLAASRGALTDIITSPVLWVALVLYGGVTVIWVLLLREVELSRAYPVIAATYVLIPAVSVLFLGEKLGPYYPYGVVLILAGIVLVLWT